LLRLSHFLTSRNWIVYDILQRPRIRPRLSRAGMSRWSNITASARRKPNASLRLTPARPLTRLTQAYSRISDPKLRRGFLDLIENAPKHSVGADKLTINIYDPSNHE
jgi:hypothetical protein